MKSGFLIFMCVLGCTIMQAQNINNYTFSAGNSAYVKEPGTLVTITAGNRNDGYVNSIAIGFDFWYMGTRYTHAGISTNGWMTLGNGLTAINNATPANSFSVAGSTVTRPVIAPLWDDLDFTESNGAITYSTTGTTPNRVFTVEWADAEWGLNTNDSVITFRVRLYETSGKVVFEYQQGNAPASGASASIGISGSSNTIFRSLNSSSNSATTSSTISTNTINTLPDNGQTFSFTPPVLPAPGNVNFTNVTINSMTVNWSDNSSAESGYAIYMSPDNTNFYFVLSTGPNITSYNIGGLYTGMPYYYRIYTISEGSFSIAATGSRSTLNGTMSGTYSIPGNYPTINAAIAAIQSNGMAGKVVFELQNNYTGAGETYPIDVPTTLGNTSDKTITLRPAANVSSVAISGSSNGSVITLNGAKYFIIDGRPGGTGNTRALKIYNSNVPSSQPGSALALSLINDACNDTIRYCEIMSEGFSVLSIGTTWGGIGNSNNSIDHCLLRGGLSSNTSDILVATGTAGKANSSNTIAFNEFYDFAPQNLPGLPLSLNGTNVINIGANNTDYRIVNNHIYQPVSATSFSSSFYQVGIAFLNNSGKVTITDNYIGGSAPYCGGSAWEFGPASTNNSLIPIRVTCSTSQLSIIERNTVNNFILATSGPVINAGSGIMDITGIWVNGLCKIKNNAVGSKSATGAFAVSVNAPQNMNTVNIYGIFATMSTDSTVNNSVAGFKITPSDKPINFTGIQGGGSVVALNTVGSISTANSIQIGSGNVQNRLIGISGTGGIINNTVANLTNLSAGSSSLAGISTSTGNISGNTVYALKSASASQDGLMGIFHQNMSSVVPSVNGNKVHSLTALAGAEVTGIYLQNYASAAEVSRNAVHSLEQSGSANGITGIRVSGNCSITNNMIRLGFNADGSSITQACAITGINNQPGSQGISQVLHNSIYIGGAGVANGTANTIGFLSTSGTAGNNTFYNNIVCNARSNASGGGTHMLLYYAALSSDYNLFYTYGASFKINQYNSLNAYQAGSSNDRSSAESDPVFVNATGNATTGDLHLQTLTATWAEGHGNSNFSTLFDFDGDTRTRPADIGADAGNFTGVPVNWLSFNAKVANKTAELYWQTASEKNNKGFEVERSFDGMNFIPVGFVKGYGNTSNISAYRFTDYTALNDVQSQQFTMILYRLKQVDFNGAFAYSVIKTIHMVQHVHDVASVYPNPFSDLITIDAGAYSGTCMLRISDAFGKIVKEQSYVADAGRQVTIDTRLLNNGIYMVKLIRESGTEQVFKLVK